MDLKYRRVESAVYKNNKYNRVYMLPPSVAVLSDTYSTLLFSLPGLIHINKVAEKVKVMMSKIGIEIERFTLVQDTIRGPSRVDRLAKAGYEMTRTEDIGDGYN